MSIVNPIKYTVLGQVIPRDQLPECIISSDNMAYGTVELQLPIDILSTLTAKVFRLASPTTAEDRWSRLGNDIYSSDILYFDFYQQDSDTNYYVIRWRFLPVSLTPPPLHEDHFSIEFFVNESSVAITDSATAKIIITIKNPIDCTGITGILIPTASYFQGATGVGDRGQTGIQGITGAYGGPPGSTGVAGVTGAGIQGSTGVLGATGLVGGQGATGLYGIKGNAGEQGETGIVGSSIKGATGIRGQTGFGIQGNTGLTGGTGIKGSTGIRGTTGISVQGITGLIGGTGVLGKTGIQGTTGFGIQGQTGKTGIQGGTGLYGIRGFEGEQGDTGLAGPKGATGVEGQHGHTGIRGVTGLVGGTGIRGLGLTGLQGRTGIQGVTGIQGLTGFYGQTGIDGQTGIQGGTGIQGETGFYGQTGVSGVTGIGYNGIAIHVPFDSSTAPYSRGYFFDRTDNGDTTSYSIHGEYGEWMGEGAMESEADIVIEGICGDTTGGKFVIRGNGVNKVETSFDPIQPVDFHCQVAIDNCQYEGLVVRGGLGAQIYTDNSNLPARLTFAGDLSSPDQSGEIYGWQQDIVLDAGLPGDAKRIKIYKMQLPDQTNNGWLKTYGSNGSLVVDTTTVGLQGGTGIQGVTGILGINGDQGVTGISGGGTGLQGETGIQGVTGFGVQGDTGVQGVTGVGQTGIQGETGIQGFTGLALGSTGIQGGTGLVGETGIQGIGLTGLTGGTGIQGVTGIRGFTGLLGGTGLQGQTGIRGPTGIRGVTGIQGETGIQGGTGIQGQTGIQGFTGLALGSTGLQGITGLANFIEAGSYPAIGVTPTLLWNETSNALFAGITGSFGKWIQISAGASQGGQGVTGIGSTERVWSVTLGNPIAATLPGPKMKVNGTLTRISSHIVGGTNVVFNIYDRTNVSQTGTALMTASQTATTTGVNNPPTGSFASTSLPADSWLYLKIDSTSGLPSWFTVSTAFTV